MATLTNRQIRAAYVIIIKKLWEGRLSYNPTINNVCNDVCNYVDNIWRELRLCNNGMGDMSGWMKSIFWPGDSAADSLRQCLNGIQTAIDDGLAEPGETFTTAIQKWVDLMVNPSNKGCVDAIAARTGRAISSLIVENDVFNYGC